jgi:enamine deaminase RidA (YjgF/YER057c/UK114 family)
MTGRIDTRLKDLGIDLPAPPAPVASYVPTVKTGNLVFVSGQIPAAPDGLKYVGIIGQDLSVEDGKAAARLCAINLLAQAKAACDGDLDRVTRCVKLSVFINAVPGFTQHPEIANGASDLMVEVFGDAGKHARAAVGSGSLPRGTLRSRWKRFSRSRDRRRAHRTSDRPCRRYWRRGVERVRQPFWPPRSPSLHAL